MGKLVDPGFMVNPGSMGNPGFMGNPVSMVNLDTMVNPATMGFKKRPLDVAKSHFNSREGPFITVLALVIRVHGATLMGLKTQEHGAIVRN